MATQLRNPFQTVFDFSMDLAELKAADEAA
jgi:hypothetical protein